MRSAVRSGAFVGAIVAGLVVLLALVPALARGYPLALLPLLAAGPVSVQSGPRRAESWLLRGFVAGLIAAVIAVVALVFAVNVLNASVWALTGPASYAPMPTLPRPNLIPGVLWPHQDILLLLPPISAVWAVVYAVLLGAPGTGLVRALEGRVATARASLQAKLVWVLLVLVAFAVALGWVGFSALEDLHLRGHTLQLRADWMGHAAAMAADVEGVVTAAAVDDPAARATLLQEHAASLQGTLDHLERPGPHPGVALGAAAVADFSAQYAPDVAAVRATVAPLLAAAGGDSGAPGDRVGATRAAALDSLAAVTAFTQHVQADTRTTLDATDFQHHASLMALLALVAISALAGLVLGQAAAASITRPVRLVGAQLSRVAQGDFSSPPAVPNRDELGELAAQLNAMTVELDRLYTVERDGRRIAEELAEREHELNTAREFWAHTIVHDLKSPLTVATGYAELLAHGHYGALTVEQVEAARQIGDSLQQVLLRAQNIVDMFRLRQASIPLEPEPERASDVLGAAARASQKPDRAPIRVELRGDVGAVLADRRLVQRVLENLISNSFHHGGPSVAVTLRGWREGDGVALCVEDNGPGIPDENRGRVFQLFERAPTGGGSTGLGLTFCRLVVERHGGRIWLADVPGGGMRVCFTLQAASWALPATA
ncbi:MAG TPA: HAMP domain-containing sensor histidine kinase [Chloroflexota bacterium]|jgi:signal transduction histidine kinase